MTATAYIPPGPPARGLPAPQHVGADAQPVSRVVWKPRGSLTANGWNPNRAASPEMRLLAISILEDGWTQPIVARTDGVIVDGFHRWTIAGWPAIAAMTDGLVPVVELDTEDEAQQRMATVRHNRARGSHYVLSMADIVGDLTALGIPPEEIERRLQMEPEEVSRLLDRGNMPKRGSADTFSKGWRPE